MAMTLKSRRELYKLREIMHFLLQGSLRTNLVTDGPFGLPPLTLVCYFCKKPFSYAEEFNTHGNTIGPKFAEKLSIHHLDGNHDNNERENKALCHTSCHKSHHRKEANTARAAARKP